MKSTVLPILGKRNSTSTKEGPRQKFGSIVGMKEMGERQHGGGGSALRATMTHEDNRSNKFSLPTQKFRNQQQSGQALLTADNAEDEYVDAALFGKEKSTDSSYEC